MPSKQSKDYDPLALVKPLDRTGLRVREFVPMTHSPMTEEVAKRIAIYRSYPSKQP